MSTRQVILDFVKRRGLARAEDIATHAGITPSGIRQHLTALERDGLLACRERREGPGRPKHFYELTESADALFPRRYDDLANELLSYVQDESPDLVARVFERRAARRLENGRLRTAGLPFDAKVREVAKILDDDGYLADFQAQPDGSYLITEHNCAVLGVARKYAMACGSELQFLQDLLPEAEVERVAHMLSGAHVCAYRVASRGQGPGTPGS
jgi:predicted ArsR family transcriptional regulator